MKCENQCRLQCPDGLVRLDVSKIGAPHLYLTKRVAHQYLLGGGQLPVHPAADAIANATCVALVCPVKDNVVSHMDRWTTLLTAERVCPPKRWH